jgi:hypothetical protein
MDYLIQNALEIMYLFLGTSAFIFSVSVAITLSKINYILGKFKSWVNFFDQYLQGPMEMVKSVYKFMERLV